MEDWNDGKQEPLVEELDFYVENGLYVFTEYYLEKRGYCCKNGCRHCPYGFKKVVRKEGLDSKRKLADNQDGN